MTEKALTNPTGGDNGLRRGGMIIHYTQVVWAETTDVGCGYIASTKGPMGPGSVSEILIRKGVEEHTRGL